MKTKLPWVVIRGGRGVAYYRAKKEATADAKLNGGTVKHDPKGLIS